MGDGMSEFFGRLGVSLPGTLLFVQQKLGMICLNIGALRRLWFFACAPQSRRWRERTSRGVKAGGGGGGGGDKE